MFHIIYGDTPLFTDEFSPVVVNSEYDSGDSYKNLKDQFTINIPQYLLEHNSANPLPVAASRKNVENLYPVLDHFGNDKCLIVINNFLGTDILMNNLIPIILRRFGLVILQAKKHSVEYSDSIKAIWSPSEHLTKITGNYTTNDEHTIIRQRHISEHFTPLSLSDSSGYCVGLNPDKFSSSSKPWACEVQIDLFMPKKFILS